MLSNRFVKRAFVCSVVGVIGVGLFASTASAIRQRPRPCICPDVYAPVICPNGLVYSNGCQAGCAGQTNCVPWGGDVK